MRVIASVLLFLVASAAYAQVPSWCYYYSNLQGCDPFGNLTNHQWQACPEGCNADFTECAGGITWFEEKGADWNYTNGVTQGYIPNQTYSDTVLNLDHFNVCSEEGDCECVMEDDPNQSGVHFVIYCKRQLQFTWEDHTINLDLTNPCTPPPGGWGGGGGGGGDDDEY